jgi:hypothetical protein
MSATALRSKADELARFDTARISAFQRSFCFSELQDSKSVRSKIKSQLNQKHPFIYLIFANAEASTSKIVDAFKEAKEAEKGRNYSRINERMETCDSRCLYVGSSNPGFARFTQHFGYASKQTYSLHLSSWAPELPGGVEIDIISFLDEEDSRLLPFVEDSLAAIHKPTFGRRGSA